MKKKVARSLVALLFAAILFTPAFAPAATTYTWQGATGFWHINANWSPLGIPTFGDTALVNTAGSTVNLNGNYGNTIGNLTITSENEVRTTITSPNYNTTFTFSVPAGSASLTNDGVFRLADTGLNSHLMASNNLGISGSGRIILESAAQSRIYNISTYNITNGANHTIEGVGTIDPYAMVNYGIIQANSDRLLMARNFYNFTGGVLRSNPEAVLQLGIWYNSSSGLGFMYDGRGGVIDLNGGTVKGEVASFLNADVRNSAAPGGTLELVKSLVSSNSFDFRENTAIGAGVVVNVNSYTSMFTSGTGTVPKPVVTNNGVINLLAADGGYSDFSASQSTLTGSGKVVLNGDARSRVLGGSSGYSLTNDVNHTIEGGGKIANYIINKGVILANNGNLVLDAIISGAGQVLVKDGAKVIVAGGRYPYNNLATQSLTMTQNAAIQVDWNCYVTASRFMFAMTDPSKWSWDSSSTLYMAGTGSENFLEVGGRTDLPNPFVNNFALPNLVISSGEITLVDEDHNTLSPNREALYVTKLTVSPGAVLNLNNLSLWCYLDGNLHQVRAGEGALFGGGQIINRPLKPITTPILLLLLDD